MVTPNSRVLAQGRSLHWDHFPGIPDSAVHQFVCVSHLSVRSESAFALYEPFFFCFCLMASLECATEGHMRSGTAWGPRSGTQAWSRTAPRDGVRRSSERSRRSDMVFSILGSVKAVVVLSVPCDQGKVSPHQGASHHLIRASANGNM